MSCMGLPRKNTEVPRWRVVRVVEIIDAARRLHVPLFIEVVRVGKEAALLKAVV